MDRTTSESPASEVAEPQPRTLGEQLDLQLTRFGLGVVSDLAPVQVDDSGRFWLHGHLGHGGMGSVYLARDTVLDREVALKVVHHSRPGDGEQEHSLLREARALAMSPHDNVLQVYDVGTARTGEPFIAMEYVPGRTLAEWQKGRSISEILDAHLLAGRGLMACHERGVVHRDFKPENVLVQEHDGRSRVVVGDFGLARVHEPQRALGGRGAGAESSTPGLQGTPLYMSPEQYRRMVATPLSDQFSFCVTLWRGLAGEHPFALGQEEHVQWVVLPRPKALPRWLYPHLRRGLSVEPSERHPSMRSLLGGISASRRRRRWLAVLAPALILTMVAVVTSYWLGARPPSCADAGTMLSEAWSARDREAITRAFMATELTYASDVSKHILGQLDGVIEQWHIASEELCVLRGQEPASPVFERREQCLERWRGRIIQRIELLRVADARVVDHAHELLQPLIREELSCRSPGPPLDPRVQQVLDRAEDAELTGEITEGRERARAAIELARTHGIPCVLDAPYVPEMGAAWYRLGHVLGSTEDIDGSVQALAQASVHAIACDDIQLLVDAQTYLAQVLALDRERPEAATQAVASARAALSRLDASNTSQRRHELSKAEAFIALVEGDARGATAAYERALEELGDRTLYPLLVAKLYNDMGAAWHEFGSYENAAMAYEQALSLIQATLGSAHPEARLHVAWIDLNRALLARDQRRLDLAAKLLAQTAAVDLPALAVKSRTISIQIAHEQEDFVTAARRARDLAKLVADNPTLSSRSRAEALATAGQALASVGDENGLALLGEALDMWTSEFPDDVNRDICALQEVMALLQLDRVEDARTRLDELRAMLRPDDDDEVRAWAQALAEELAAEH